MSELDKWDSFYVIVGSAAGALIGLQFVVMTLVAERPGVRTVEGGAAFSTPTIVHFSAVLLLAALLRAPWEAAAPAAALCAALGLAGAAYVLLTVWRMHVQTVYRPDLEDWLFHGAVPLAAYALLAGSAYAAFAHARTAWFGVAGATLLLLFDGIHNAWDAAAFHVLTKRKPSGRDENG